MIRAILDEALLFLLPFAAFALYLILRRRNPFFLSHWSDQTVTLVIAGLVIVIGALIYTGLTSDHQTGAFRPAHVENGRVVPGQFK